MPDSGALRACEDIAMKLDVLKSHKFASVTQEYSRKDCILYALGLGYGSAPLDEAHLQFLFEERLKAVPSMTMVLGHTGFWARDPAFGIDWVKLLHAQQAMEVLRPLQPQGQILARTSIVAVEDKGVGRGALVYQQREIIDAGNSELLAKVGTTLFLRGDGGCGSFGEPPAAPGEIQFPATGAAKTLHVSTLPHAALIYRLSGDWNPIHADPATARKAGFDRPILHGLCTMGIACRAVIEAYADNDPARLRYLSVRFSKPVFPGETLAIEFIEEQGVGLRFRARVPERDTVVLDRGLAVVNCV
jgi:acyl dehydratase